MVQQCPPLATAPATALAATPQTAAAVAAAASSAWMQIERHFAARPVATGLDTVALRPSDVVVTTFPKSGTTLMQQIAYQVVALSGGGPSYDPTGLHFPDLAVVSPWVDYIPQIGIPPCESSPRTLKTHSSLRAFRKHNCKHIVVVRDPVAYPPSFLDFCFRAVVDDADALPTQVREAVFHRCAREGLVVPHRAALGGAAAASDSDDDDEKEDETLSRWHKFAKDSILPLREDVLVVFYEDIMSDFPHAVRKVAAFLGVSLSPAAVDEVIRRCDRATMANDSRFFCRIEGKCFGMTRDAPKAIAKGAHGFKQFKVDAAVVRSVEQMNERVFGTPKYADMREMVNKRQWEAFRR